MKKLWVVYNPRSSHNVAIREEVLEPIRGLTGWMVGKYEVKQVSVEENAQMLAKVLNDGDLVIAAGGDGTAMMAANGVMLSEKEATLAVLGYGNFNDVSRMLGVTRTEGVTGTVRKFEEGEIREIYPLKVSVDGSFWRYTLAYVTLGLFAESTRIFDEPKIRNKLKTGKKSMIFSIWNLARWYFANKRRRFLPEGRVNGKELSAKTTDIMAINGTTVAKLMKGGGGWYTRCEGFLLSEQRLGSFWRLIRFMMRSIFRRIPGEEVQKVEICFSEVSEVEAQAEGEYRKLTGVQKVEIEKSRQVLRVIAK